MSNKMTIEEIEAAVEGAWKSTKGLWVEGYTSGSGHVSNMLVRMLGGGGYKMMLEKSLTMLQKGEVGLDVSDGVQEGAKAAAALSASWAKSLKGLHKEKNYSETYDADSLKSRGFARNSRGQVVVKSLEKLSGADVTDREDKLSSRPLVRAKQEITDKTPMGRFVGQLNLDPDKVSRVEPMDLSNVSVGALKDE